ncbi:filamentous hemagglutinin family N-terminal domain-containing protein, partial [Variovorax sp. OK605]|uniref:filamentous haemagglutinin family protein n=1 Tax=Variovorax sp. OK605 TaxID=1855317 RepID=UPI0008F209F5
MSNKTFRHAPLAHAVVIALATAGLAGHAQAQRAFSAAWMAQKNMAQGTAAATGYLPNGTPASLLTNPQAQQQRANEQLQRSIGNLTLAAQAIAAQQAAQAAAREAALKNPSSVPDGLAEGGLRIDTNSLTAGWANANAPVQSQQADGRTNVAIQQTGDKAVLNWETFNVGKNTTVKFDQQPSWAVLNRVNDPNARPSQIRGQIQADGTVMIVNRNGIVFSGSSQVDTRNLLASAVGMTDAQFKRGIYSQALGTGFVPTLANDLNVTPSTSSNGKATGDVVVEAGARIATRAPQTVTEGGGYVLLAGRETHNRGTIVTPSGQTMLAAGDSFVIRKGVGTDSNQQSSTRGNEVTVARVADSTAGRVSNAGLIQALTGDITLAGHTVEQSGVLLSSTSVNTRGTVHLSATGNADARVTLAPGSVSAVLLDNSSATALDVQRDALIKDSASLSDGAYNRRDQSLVQIASSGNVEFLSDSMTLATGGQVNVNAVRRIQVADRAAIDVAGAVGVSVAMASNNVEINVQGNEQRDAPGNRDSKNLNNANLWIDRRTLVRVAAGTNGYTTDRWYTGGGLLEVSGYLNTGGHGIGEWAASGGTVAFGGGELVTQAGSAINVSGGTLDVQTGMLKQSWLKGNDGRLYNLSSAPGDMLYTGVYKGFESEHQRWGKNTTDYFYNPLIGARERLESGYTVGRDAGRVIVGTKSAVLEGEIEATVFQGDRQRNAPDAAFDSYRQAQTAAPRSGQLLIGQLQPMFSIDTGMLRDNPTALVERIDIGTVQRIAQDLKLEDALPDALKGKLQIDAGWLNRQQLGGFKAYAQGGITVDADVVLANGGSIALHATQVDVKANLGARGGSIALGDTVNRLLPGSIVNWAEQPIGNSLLEGYTRRVDVAGGVALDTHGLWTNLRNNPADIGGLPYMNGGSVTIASTGDVRLHAGTVIDTSSGAAMMADGSLQGGRGGNITLRSNQNGNTGGGAGTLLLEGELRGHGVKGGGTLTIDTGIGVAIGGGLLANPGRLAAGESVPVHLTLAEAFTIPAGTVLPQDFTYVSNVVPAGEALKIMPVFTVSRPYKLPAAWVVPQATVAWEYVFVSSKSGSIYASGNTIPAGTELVEISGKMAPGYVVPAAAFPNGMPVSDYNATVAAGTPFVRDLVLGEGTLLLAGNRLPIDVAVKPLLVLDDSVFRSGFSRYAISAQQGMQVAAGAKVDVAMPLLRADPAAARATATGADPSAVLQRWLPPVWQEDPLKGVLTQRAGADLSLSAGSVYSQAPLVVGQGATLSVDPGRSLTLTGNGQITIDGTLNAWGGRIGVLPGAFGTGNDVGHPAGSANATSIWIGSGAVLDAAGRADTATDSKGRVYGDVGSGGRIEIGAAYKADAGQVDAADAFVVIRPGARLDASGSAARLDLPGRGTLDVAGDGGLISLASYRGLFLDGDMRAAAGGAGAAGGTLAVTLETPNYGPVDKLSLKGINVDDAVRVARELVLAQVQGDSGLSAGLKVGDREAALAYGTARVGVDRIAAGGFGNLSLLANGLVSFDGDIDLRMGQSLRLTASAFGLAANPANAAPTSQVRLAAPYIRLAGSTRGQDENYIMPNPVRGSKNSGSGGGMLGLPLVAEGARLQLDAQLIDIAGQVNTGARGAIVQNAGDPLTVERLAFRQIVMRSDGDLRLSQAAQFYTPGSLTLAASQIYPAMNDSGVFVVGERGSFDKYGTLLREFDPARSLNIERIDPSAPLPAQPYSAFGRLSFSSAVVNQGGVVRAPLGEIELGAVAGSGPTGEVNLLPGGVTSVSAKGLAMPYGGTLDGLSYLYDGKDVVWKGVGNGPAVTLSAHVVNVREGAVLDLSGGGELTGTAFLPGRGGSTDARLNPLVQTTARGSFTLPGLATNPVYAIVPGAQAGHAPLVNEHGAGDPALGRQITIGAGVPGLPPGTYTLLPSTFALLPGAFRVELNGLAPNLPPSGVTVPMRNGSYAAAAQFSVTNTGIRDALPTQVFLTPADTLRSYSQYNETSYADFAIAQAERYGVPRPLLERDAKMLRFNFAQPGRPGALAANADAPALRFAGVADYTAAAGSYGGTALVDGNYSPNIEVLADGAVRTPGFTGVSVAASALNAIAAPRLAIGGMPSVLYVDYLGSSQGANIANFLSGAGNIVLREGAVLKAGEVYLVTNVKAGGIVVEQGAGINTLGRGKAAWDSRDGFVFAPGTYSVLAVSNGWLDLLAPAFSADETRGAGRIDIGACATGSLCQGVTRLYSEGTIAASTDQSFELRDAARYGTRNLVLSVGGINVGSEAALAAAAARHALAPGLTLNQGILERLLRGDPASGAPALENLVLTARDAVNFHDSIELSTIDPLTGRSSLERLVLGTPAIYGAGNADTLARIRTGILVWNGATTAPGLVAAGGAGTGSGRLQIDADQIEFGYGPNSRPDTVHSVDRLVLGFGEVVLNARERVTANHTGSLSVYQSQGAWDDALKGFAFSGGNLRIQTPLFTGQAGSVNKIKAGGDIAVSAPAGMAAPALSGKALTDALGAEIGLDAGENLTLDTRIALPSGKLTASAARDLQLADGAQLDLAGRKIGFFDVAKYSWGGDVVLESRAGDVRQSAGSRIDMSADHNRAGKLTVLALGEGAGTVDLRGAIAGASSGQYDAGGTLVPYAAGGADIRSQHIEDFTGLNRRLGEGGVFGSRSFQLKQGDLVLGDELKAREINVSVDGGRLAVNGTVDASGDQAGSIRLAARDGVTLGGAALLDAHSRVLRVDSYGQVIEAPNRAVIEIDAGKGRLVLQDGARMDVRAGTGGTAQALGTVELSAQRVGGERGNDIAIDASGKVQIDGARAITVNGFWTYNDADAGTDLAADGRPYQVVNQAYLDRKHADSLAFMGNVLANGNLMNTRLAGLRAYGDAFHLRPGVSIVSATPDGDLHVDGDIDLSGYRYASVNPRTQQTGVYGSGESGALVLRAGGNLNVYGSITDGFDTSVLPATPSDQGWVLVKGRVPWGGDVVVPRGGLVELAEGTFFQPGRTLNFDLPMQPMSLKAGTVLATTATLSANLVLPAGTVLGGAVRDASGHVLHAAGAVLAQAVTLPAGTKLDAGNRLPGDTRVAAMTWPAGVPLPFPPGIINDTGGLNYPVNGVQLAGSLMLRKGAVVPAETMVVLPDGVTSVNLRPADADGNQGRNFALAPMLAPGSGSWSMRLVAGADIRAADTRALRPRDANGQLLLADTHYGMGGELMLQLPTPGVAGRYYWMGDSLIQIGYAPGKLIDLDEWGGEEAVQDINNWGVGDLVTWAPLGSAPKTRPVPATQQLFSVLRTGTGDLDLLAGGNFTMNSLYGVYTAGTQSAGVAAAYNQPRAKVDGMVLGGTGTEFEPFVDGGGKSLYRAWYPEHGGNVLLRAQGDVRGDLVGANVSTRPDAIGSLRSTGASVDVGNWLWRQGTGSAVAASEGVPTAWWTNFGSYVPGATDSYATFGTAPLMVGFIGIGTLGGGNLVLEAGGDAGMLTKRADRFAVNAAHSTGLNLVVGSTGRVSADGRQLTLTGGGDLDLRIGGGLNPVPELRSYPSTDEITPQTVYSGNRSDLNSTFVNLRGALRIQAGAVGGIELRFNRADPEESRAYQVYTATSSTAGGGPVLVPGDSGVRIDTRGDLVLGGVADAGRVAQPNNGVPFTANGVPMPADGYSWFSLWTPGSAIDLFSAGGNLTPSNSTTGDLPHANIQASDGRFLMPSVLRAVAASGSIYYGNSATGQLDSSNKPVQSPVGVMLAPSPVGPQYAKAGVGQLELLAADSIYAGGYGVTQSGADPTALPNPFNAGFSGSMAPTWYGTQKLSNINPDALAPTVFLENLTLREGAQLYPLFSFTPPTASGYAVVGQQPARFYASEGDVIGVRTGAIITRGTGAIGNLPTWYEGGGPVAIRAGRDIVNSGTGLGKSEPVPIEGTGWGTQAYNGNPSAPLKPVPLSGGGARGNLIVHNNPDDVSVVQAGRDVRYSTFYVAGPGVLEVTAGRDVYMADRAELKSIGPVANITPGDRSSGAGIAVAAGVGRNGPDFAAFAARYLDPANLAAGGQALAEQPGKAVTTYGDRLTLALWLSGQFGYGGDEAGAPAYLTSKQAELDRAHQQSAGAGVGGAPSRDLAREYGLSSQLHLVNWLEGRFGDGKRNGLGLRFDAASMDARTFFAALPAEQQRAFLRPVYYAELKAAGREYNAVGGPREGSYLRGREAIATLFPSKDAQGNAIDYQGDLTMFSSALYYDDTKGTGIVQVTTRPRAGVKYLTKEEWIAAGRETYKTAHYEVQDAGVHTDFGGDIRLMVPGGRTLVGVDGGFVPGEGSGVLTQGAGEIEIFSNGSILLGQSRIFTTFGGNVLAWSAQGDINAGRGSKSTVVYTPQRRVYDGIGLVSLSPNTPNTGAGIATLNPIPEIPPGDVDLIAPLGTIDAGEAGIRVSGNVNLAALRVVNAENIQVKGQSVGIPVIAAVNVGALTNASAAASQAAAAAQ